MTKYYYIILGSIGAVLLIALTILSYFDKTMFYPSKPAPDATAPHRPGVLGGDSRQQSASAKSGISSAPAAVAPDTQKALISPPLNLRLVGTTVFGEKSTAIIEDIVKGSQGIYRLNDSIQEFTITTIAQDSVTLTARDRRVVLTIASGAGSPDPDAFFTKVDDNSWLVSADKVSDMVSNIDQYVGQVIAFQHREHGESAGFKIRHLKQGNDFEKLGIQNNDVIKRVNGLEVNDITDVIKAVYQLGDETDFTIEVERENAAKDLNYRLDKNVDALVPILSRMLAIPLTGKGAQ